MNEYGVRQYNGLGIAGFVLAVIAFFLYGVPYLGWILWALGAVFSFAGLFRSPRGFAIWGLIISFIDIILLLLALFIGFTLFAFLL